MKTLISKISTRILGWDIRFNCNYDRYRGALASTVYKIFDKHTGSEIGSGINVTKKFNRRKVYAR